MSLRIIAGTFKGRRLLAPPGLETRPLPDRIKQSLFDWLGQSCADQRVVDVCAGSGSFGFEALSRGAVNVHLIDPGRHAHSILQANLRGLGTPAGVTIHTRAFQDVLPALHGIDLMFCDPPFPWFKEQRELLALMLELASGSLTSSGRLMIRGEQGHELPALPRTLRESERRRYGRSYIVMIVMVKPLPGSPPPRQHCRHMSQDRDSTRPNRQKQVEPVRRCAGP